MSVFLPAEAQADTGPPSECPPSECPPNECPRCRELEAQVRVLETHLAALAERLKAAERAGKRQAAPFPKGLPSGTPRKRGRKRGGDHRTHRHRPALPDDAVDERQDVPLPAACPHGGDDRLQELGIITQFQEELPPRRPVCRRFDIRHGRCFGYGRAMRGHPPRQTSDATGAAGSQRGSQTHAAIALLNKELGLPHGKVATVLKRLCGITITLSRATSARSVLQTARYRGDRCGRRGTWRWFGRPVSADRETLMPSHRTHYPRNLQSQRERTVNKFMAFMAIDILGVIATALFAPGGRVHRLALDAG